MEKLILLADDVNAAKAVVDTLHGLNIQDDSIDVIANEHTPLDELPGADLDEETDAVPAFKRGAVIGGATGVLAGVAAMVFPPAGIAIGGSAVLAGAVGGASFGAFASALIGVSVPNSQLDEYEQAVKGGQVLLVASVADDQLDAVKAELKDRHTGLEIKGTQDFLPPAV